MEVIYENWVAVDGRRPVTENPHDLNVGVPVPIRKFLGSFLEKDVKGCVCEGSKKTEYGRNQSHRSYTKFTFNTFTLPGPHFC